MSTAKNSSRNLLVFLALDSNLHATRPMIAHSKVDEDQRKASVFNQKSSSSLANVHSQRSLGNC